MAGWGWLLCCGLWLLAGAAFAQVEDYTCRLKRRERVGEKLKEAEMPFKYKKPARFYMKWPDDGIEAIYADLKFNTRLTEADFDLDNGAYSFRLGSEAKP